MSKLIIGLTGGIGSGKTAVSTIFQGLGIDVIDADVCSRVVVEKGKPALEEIVKHFGGEILQADGNLDRARLRSQIFQDAAKKQWLEKLLHPQIFDEMLKQLTEAQSPYAILVSPLLSETGQSGLCCRVLVIDADESEQLSRTMIRDNNSQQQVESIIKSQVSRQDRLKLADDIILNNGTLDELKQQVIQLHERYLQLSSADS